MKTTQVLLQLYHKLHYFPIISVHSIYGIVYLFHNIFSASNEAVPSWWSHYSIRLSAGSGLYCECVADSYSYQWIHCWIYQTFPAMTNWKVLYSLRRCTITTRLAKKCFPILISCYSAIIQPITWWRCIGAAIADGEGQLLVPITHSNSIQLQNAYTTRLRWADALPDNSVSSRLVTGVGKCWAIT